MGQNLLIFQVSKYQLRQAETTTFPFLGLVTIVDVKLLPLDSLLLNLN